MMLIIAVWTAAQEGVVVREPSQLECATLKNKQLGVYADTLAF